MLIANDSGASTKFLHLVNPSLLNLMFFPPSSFRRSEEIDASLAGDRAILYHRRIQKAIVLNPTGTLLWELLASPQTFEDLSQQLQLHFPHHDASQLRCDIENYLGELVEQEAILTSPSSSQ